MLQFAPLEAGQAFGDYRIDDVIGEGGWGVVYRATEPALDREVALKVIRPPLYAAGTEAQRRFARESKSAAAVQHPNIIPIYRAGEVDGQPFIAMRFVAGPNLQDFAAERGRLDAHSAVKVITQVASALQAAHAKGVIHRDVKPANVLIDNVADPHVYLTDFGVAKIVASSTNLTVTSMPVGTLDFIAPEQLEHGAIDARTDVYALGCLLFYVLAGRPPFEGYDMFALMFAHAHSDPPSLLDVGVEREAARFDGVIRTAMAKPPDQRFQTADAFAAAVAAAVAPERARPPAAGTSAAADGAIPRSTKIRPVVRTRSRFAFEVDYDHEVFHVELEHTEGGARVDKALVDGRPVWSGRFAHGPVTIKIPGRFATLSVQFTFAFAAAGGLKDVHFRAWED